MKEFKNFVMKAAAFLPAIALIIGVITSNSACVTFYHQPETPDAMNAYRK